MTEHERGAGTEAYHRPEHGFQAAAVFDAEVEKINASVAEDETAAEPEWAPVPEPETEAAEETEFSVEAEGGERSAAEASGGRTAGKRLQKSKSPLRERRARREKRPAGGRLAKDSAAADDEGAARRERKAAARPRRKKDLTMRQRMGFGNRRWGKLSRREKLILLFPAAAAVIAVAVVLLLHQDVSKYEIEGKACQYYGGNIYRMQEGSVLRRNSEGETILGEEKDAHKMTSLPVYYEDKEVVTLPQDMVYYTPRDGGFSRVDYFTDIRFRKGANPEAVRDGREKAMAPGFLFDGRDLYLFLEPMSVVFNGYQLELPAMSYVEAVHTGDVMAFNYGVKEFVIEEPRGAVTATSIGGDYTISLLSDSMTSYDGTRTLLFARPELLQPMS